jgi:hypothetical protein
MSRACAKHFFHAPPLPLPRNISSHWNHPYYNTWCELARYYYTGIPFGADTTSTDDSSNSSIERLRALSGVNAWSMPRCPMLFVFGREHGKRKVFFHTDTW